MQHSRRRGERPARRGSAKGHRQAFRPSADLAATFGYLVLASLFGGGLVQWSLPNILLVTATGALAVYLAWRDGFACLSRTPLPGRLALVGIAALPLLQVVPLPPAIWQALPGQELRQATLGMVGNANTWQPLSLEPASTAICAILAIGFVSFTGLLLRLGAVEFRIVLVGVFAMILLGIVAGLLQVVSDGQFPQFGEGQGAIMLGFFSNKNHMATAIACAILLVGQLARGDEVTPARRRLAVGGFTLFALVCIVTTNSRAGLGLGLLAAAIVLADLAHGVAMRWRLVALGVIALLAVAIVTSSAFGIVFSRVNDTGDDLRWQFAAWSWPLLKQYSVLGSGFGAFKTVYQAHEHLAWVFPNYVNAVHDDYLQLVIEAGVPGLVVLLLLVLSLVICVAAWWSLPKRDPHRREMALGFAIVILFALHSVLDYPLRRPAAWIILSVALACAYRGMPRERSLPANKAFERLPA